MSHTSYIVRHSVRLRARPFLFRQIHEASHGLDKAGATSTDTIHRVKVRNNTDSASLCASSIILSLSHGRRFAGGLRRRSMELEPQRQRTTIPIKGAAKLDLERVDRLLRRAA